MKIPFVTGYVFWTPWWDVDHHVYGCPIEVIVHTPRWNLMVRPFSNFAQGGDRRGEVEWRETREGPSPYERKQVARWVLADEKPEIWESVTGRWLDRQYCVNCLARLTDPTACPEGDHAELARRWERRYWRARRREPVPRTGFCLRCLHDAQTCSLSGYDCRQPSARRLVFLRHLWLVHVRERKRCRIRIKDLREVRMGPCDTCGEPYEFCPVSDPEAEWTTDANGNHDGLCCEDCGHHAL